MAGALPVSAVADVCAEHLAEVGPLGELHHHVELAVVHEEDHALRHRLGALVGDEVIIDVVHVHAGGVGTREGCVLLVGGRGALAYRDAHGEELPDERRLRAARLPCTV